MGAYNKVLSKNDLLSKKVSCSDSVVLTIDERRCSRLITKTKKGVPCVIVLERGFTLRDGFVLQNEQGDSLLVEAALEQVSTVTAKDEHELVTLAYHLGNRHVPLEIGTNYLRYQEDHVLDELILGLGGNVVSEQNKFEPEDGAYSHHH